jgi:hypothetical protein
VAALDHRDRLDRASTADPDEPGQCRSGGLELEWPDERACLDAAQLEQALQERVV